ncbi:mitochondrial glutamate carrier 1-like isoform X2 [Diaphorina citri]|uniref:Mitochondrial glutamate carrier 1-like isoform X1 n=1 Tax=Diaphorina citri TaxID=121845 RepID=A0A3Q0IVF4_DIACI|nr:mitochondrial glutamate carrier 1-like isoform X1 [Diaphorina citri]XP_026680229.1 mitochondrial glutamate carrier 1-like isoform X2 [Diaphorina citri]
MYRGSGVNILLITPEKAIKLAANDFFRHHLAPSNGEPLSLVRGMAAGGLAGLCQIVITTPMELLKIQMQDAGRVMAQAKLAGEVVPKISATSIALELVKTKGIVGLYKGTTATALRDVSFSVVYFPLFAQLNSLGPRKKDGSGEAAFYWSFLSGCISGSMAALSVNPFDVIKTRLQVLKKGQGELHYNGVSDAIM